MGEVTLTGVLGEHDASRRLLERFASHPKPYGRTFTSMLLDATTTPRALVLPRGRHDDAEPSFVVEAPLATGVMAFDVVPQRTATPLLAVVGRQRAEIRRLDGTVLRELEPGAHDIVVVDVDGDTEVDVVTARRGYVEIRFKTLLPSRRDPIVVERHVDRLIPVGEPGDDSGLSWLGSHQSSSVLLRTRRWKVDAGWTWSARDASEEVGLTGLDVRIETADDLDRDGDADLVAVDRDGAARVLWRSFDGAIAGATSVGSAMAVVTASSDDTDGDGRHDIVIVEEDGRVAIATQEPLRGFTPSHHIGRVEGARTLAWIDADNDGDLDLAVGAADRCALFMRRPTGFVHRVTLTLPSDARLIADDLDVDGRVDLIGLDGKGTLRAAMNRDPSGNGSVRVELCGHLSNGSAVGAVVEGFAGSRGLLRARPRRGTATLGTGAATAADSWYVRWPDGLDQAAWPPTVRRARKCACPHELPMFDATTVPTQNGFRVHQSAPAIGG